VHEEHELIHNSAMTEIFGLESFLLKSVGITIGSSTTHLMFSQLTVRRSDSRASRFAIVEREVIHRSPVIFTPYIEGLRVDTEKLRNFFTDVYHNAKITPDAVDTGAVIITGYAARKENAGGIVNLFSRWAGKFVCETAGPNLEGMMAAHGSGAVRRSKETGKTVMNVDTGGGTSKIAIIRDGTVLETSSLFVGSRVVAKDSSGQLIRMEESGSLAAKEIGIDLRLGAPLAVAEQEALADILTKSLFELIERKVLSPFTQLLMETAPINYRDNIDIIMFSGGVAEYIYGHEKSDFGDLGSYLGEKIRQRVLDSEYRMTLRKPEERIRATVLGAAQYSLQVSGNTIFISSNVNLPMRNLQVIKVRLEMEAPSVDSAAASVRKALERYDLDPLSPDRTVALAIHIASNLEIGPALLRGLTGGILSAGNDYFGTAGPLMLIFDIDIANLVGNILAEKSEDSRPILCIDGIDVGDLDYVDIGMEIQSSRTVPVVIKNLVFSKISES
jgi:ethanolamine utilization protein EutA